MKRLLTTVFFIFTTLNSVAQINIVKSDSLNHAAKELIKTGENNIFNDARTPRFVITDSTQKFLFGVGGYVASKAFYDFTGFGQDGFYVDQFTTPYNPQAPDKLGFGVTGSKIIFKLLGDTKLGILETTFETAFHSDYTMYLSKAYVRFGNFLIGQDWGIATDSHTSPDVLDPADPVAKFGYKIPQVRYSFDASDVIRLYFSLEFPSLKYNYKGEEYLISEFLPDINAKILYRSRSGIYTGQAATILRYIKPDATEITNLNTVRKFAYGITTSHQIKIGSNQFYLNASAGVGISDQFAGSMAYNLNLLQVSTLYNDHYFLPLASWGVIAAWKKRWSENGESNLVASYLEMCDCGMKEGTVMPSELPNKQLSVSMNYLHTIIENMSVGAELLYGIKETYSRGNGYGARLGLFFRYNF